ncbi:histidine kinase [Leifsonia sp. NPDC058292]|uniref:histidine kinase n=1 Tax=Leifsonia sp. NPDC058292 TaxID=3346428 RepID=UPI0036DBF243
MAVSAGCGAQLMRPADGGLFDDDARVTDARVTRVLTVDTTFDAPPVGVRARLTHLGARRWYPGAVVGLLYQVSTLAAVWSSPGPLGSKLVVTLLLSLVYIGFLVLPPLFWWSPIRHRASAVGLYFLLNLTLFPFIGVSACWTWVYVACVIGMLSFPPLASIVSIGALAAAQLVIVTVTGSFDDNWYIALITFSLGVMMFAFARQIESFRSLKRAQGEIARLAVIEERGRFSRDMHDVLGHSLTVVTVKSELARRLVAIDPARAEAEIADIERLSRSALADLRAAVAGYREMSLSTELAAAQAGLAAADIRAHLPRNGEEVAPQYRELFGWVLREGVTNVIRHSGSRNCWVSVTADSLDVEDDGRGLGRPGVLSAGGDAVAGRGAEAGDPDALVSEPTPGSGLEGLTARARAAGARVLVGPSEHGGVRLTVRKADV